MSVKKDMKQLEAQAKAQGWKIEPTRGGHVKWIAPNNGGTVFAAATPSDHRSLRNHLALLRQRGFDPKAAK